MTKFALVVFGLLILSSVSFAADYSHEVSAPPAVAYDASKDSLPTYRHSGPVTADDLYPAPLPTAAYPGWDVRCFENAAFDRVWHCRVVASVKSAKLQSCASAVNESADQAAQGGIEYTSGLVAGEMKACLGDGSATGGNR